MFLEPEFRTTTHVLYGFYARANAWLRGAPWPHSDPQLAPGSLHRSEAEPANQQTSETITLLPFKVREVSSGYKFKDPPRPGSPTARPALSDIPHELGLYMSKLEFTT